MTLPLPARLIPLGCFFILSLLLGISESASLAEWQRRSIYQVITDRFTHGHHANDSTRHLPPCEVVNGLYCGGTWQGIKANLDYIQGMNFDAIWISPVVAQVPQQTGDGEAYTAYWQQDLYALNPHFGTADDLKDLVAAVHKRGMLLMLDIVVNHMGYAGVGTFVDYSVLNPFNDEKYYHEYNTITNYENQTDVQRGWLGDWMVTLADLRTEDEEVQDMFGHWISGMVANYSIDGLRIDTSINVDPPFFTNFVKSAGVFATGEVMQGDDTLACQWADTIGSILNYPIYYPLTRAFQSNEGSINDLVETINSVKANCPNSTAFGSFSENHDVPRFASYTEDLALAKNIITYTIMADGIPIIYQGQEQHMDGGVTPYLNRAPLWDSGYNTSAPLYSHIATLNQFRQHTMNVTTGYADYMAEVIYQDMHSLAMRKGFNGSQVITVLNNNGMGAEYFELPVVGHDFQPGTRLTEMLTCTNLTVDDNGVLTVPMFAGTPKVIFPERLMANSSLCGLEAGREPLPSSMTITTSVATTIDGSRTMVPTTQVVPVTASTTTSAWGGESSHRALGGAQSLMPNMPLTVAVAVIATAATSSYLAVPAAGGHYGHWAQGHG